MTRVRSILGVLGMGLFLAVRASGAENLTAAEKESNRQFAGLNFGVGLSVSFDNPGTRGRIERATIDASGIVRADKKNNSRARVMLESHYFFRLAQDVDEVLTRGWGPMFALQPGEDELIKAIGAGVMVGFRRDGDEDQSFNIGMGYIVDPSERVLGAEFRENAAAPLDPEGDVMPIRYEEKDQGGIFVLFSFTW